MKIFILMFALFSVPVFAETTKVYWRCEEQGYLKNKFGAVVVYEKGFAKVALVIFKKNIAIKIASFTSTDTYGDFMYASSGSQGFNLQISGKENESSLRWKNLGGPWNDPSSYSRELVLKGINCQRNVDVDLQ
jgi:hypothetical protein